MISHFAVLVILASGRSAQVSWLIFVLISIKLSNRFYCSTGILVTSARQLPTTEVECEPGTNFKIDCNRCICLEDGRAACTKKLCRSVKSALCTPGEHFKVRCNDCACLDDGSTVCTEKLCGDESGIVEKLCIPGEVFKKGCNTCICLDDGQPACTKIFCPRRASAIREPDTCLPGRTFMLNDCVKCDCSLGGIPDCSKRYC